MPAASPINHGLEKYRYSFRDLLSCQKTERKKPPVPLREFRNEPFLLLKQCNNSYERSMSLCRRAGFQPHVSAYLSQMMTAYYMVCEGQGAAFLRSTIPKHVTPTDSVIFYRLEGPEVTRNIYLSYLKQNTTPMQQNLVDFMCDCLCGNLS